MTNQEAADIRARDEAVQAYLGKRCSYTEAELRSAGLNPPTNEERSAVEVFEFCRDKPEKYFLYVTITEAGGQGGIATTWTGEKLGDCRLGHIYGDNFGGKRQSITVRAINGETYHGTYFKSAGDYARVKKAKHK